MNGQRVYRNTNLGTINYRTGQVNIRSVRLTLSVGEIDLRFRVISRFGRITSKELFTLTYEAGYDLSNVLTLYNQNLVPPPADNQTFVTVSDTEALPSTDVVYSSVGVASSGVSTPTTTTSTSTSSTPTTTSPSTSSSSGGGGGGGGAGGGGY